MMSSEEERAAGPRHETKIVKLRNGKKLQRHSKGQRFKRVRLQRAVRKSSAFPGSFARLQGTADEREGGDPA
jgi:hypothetical protein